MNTLAHVRVACHTALERHEYIGTLFILVILTKQTELKSLKAG